MYLPLILVSVAVALFAVFPLTDTDIWWHLACAREWVTTWTPVREPVVNVHEFFQHTVAFVYNIGGADLLVAFKALLWGFVFALFLLPTVKSSHSILKTNRGIAFLCIALALLYVFRYQFEMRPIVFSLLFLGIYWNLLPWLFKGWGHQNLMRYPAILIVLLLQWIWCKFQGLYILGPFFAYTVFSLELWDRRWAKKQYHYKSFLFLLGFVILLFVMPFFHEDGIHLFPYPFGLLDRLVGLSPSATIFANGIAENRSPITLLLNGENVLQSSLMLGLCVYGFVLAIIRWSSQRSSSLLWTNAERTESIYSGRWQVISLVVTIALTLIAERNFVLFLPVFFAFLFTSSQPQISRVRKSYYAQVLNARLGNARARFKDALNNRVRPVVNRSLRPLTSRLPSTYNRLNLPFVLRLLVLAFVAFHLGLWLKSVSAYDSMIAYQRVPVHATEWMKSHPHPGRLFNDDRAGGYLAFMNPSDSTYIDGRFILKTAEFFENYLDYAEHPQVFLHDAKVQNIDRVVLPLRYYARWDKLLSALDSAENWHVAYRDSLFVVMDRTGR